MKVGEEGKVPQEMLFGSPARANRGQESVVSFQRVLRTSDGEHSQERLHRLLGEITTQGEAVASRLDVGEVRRYRELVAQFLAEAMNQTYEAQREGLFDNRGRYKEYSVVRKVNAELEKLTQSVLGEQQDNLDVLEQLGIIRGLLVDLLV